MLFSLFFLLFLFESLSFSFLKLLIYLRDDHFDVHDETVNSGIQSVISLSELFFIARPFGLRLGNLYISRFNCDSCQKCDTLGMHSADTVLPTQNTEQPFVHVCKFSIGILI